MKMIKAEGIPVIVTAFAIFIGFVSLFLGGQALFDGTAAIGYVEGAEALGVGWGGRNMGIGLFLLLAVLLRSPAGYAIGLLGGVMREMFTDADTFGVEFGPQMSPELRTLTLAATFLIDFLYFEDRE